MNYLETFGSLFVLCGLLIWIGYVTRRSMQARRDEERGRQWRNHLREWAEREEQEGQR